MNLANKVLIALTLGIGAGVLINLTGADTSPWVSTYLVNGVFYVAGKLFFNALQMLVVPLVLFSLIPGIVGIGDIRLLGKVGTKSFALYLATTAIAITLGITLASAMGIGQGMEIPTGNDFAGQEAARSFVEVIIGIVPKNLIAAMANGEMLAIIFFAIFFGIALLIKLEQSRELVNLIEQLNRVVMQMVEMVMWFAPYAVFCLVAKAVADLGLDIILSLGGYFTTVMLALIMHAFVTQMVIMRAFTGLSIRTFLSKIRAVQIFAFSTSSSGATIPVTLRTMQERFGIDRAVSSFTVPFGATINMDGTAIMQGVATVFVANLYGIDLTLGGYVTIVVTAVLASIGTAAVPAVGLVMLTMVFKQVGLPIEAIGIILGIDRIVDMTRTAVNVTGDAVVTTIVAKSEGKMDVAIFNDPNAGEVHEVHLEDINHTTKP